MCRPLTVGECTFRLLDGRPVASTGVPTSYRTSATLEPFTLDADYADRQRIVVVPDEVAEAERRARKQVATTTSERSRPDQIASVALDIVGSTTYVVLARQVIKAVERFREKGLDLWLVGRSEISEVVFPPGHPLDNVVYIGHPVIREQYFPAAEFHRRVFESKFCEAVELLMALGATEVSVQREEGYGRDELVDVAVPLSPVDSVAGTGARTSKKSSTALFEGSFRPGREPFVPERLAWLSSERSWQTLITARMEHGATRFGLVLRYESDYGVNAALKGQIEGVGLSLGGQFVEQRSTVWRLDAAFGS